MEEVSASPLQDHYTAEEYARYLQRKERRARGEIFQDNLDIDIARKDGSVRNLQVFMKSVLWNGKQERQIIYNDITERKQAEEALKASEGSWLLQFASVNANAKIMARFTTPLRMSAGRLNSGKHHNQIIQTKLNTVMARSSGGKKTCGLAIPCQASPLLKKRRSWAIKSKPSPKSKRLVYRYLLVRFPINTV